MYGTISDERAVKVPASEACKLYGTLRLAKLVEESVPQLITKVHVVEGDGGAGTILAVFFPPGSESEVQWLKEKFKVVDDEKRVKVAEVVEGGYLDLGFTLYRFRLEVIEGEGEEKQQCIIRSAVEYELREEAAANSDVVSIRPLTAIAKLAADYLERSYKN